MVVVWGCGLGLRGEGGGEGGLVVEECHVYIPESSSCGSVECLKVICTYLLRLAVFSDVTQAGDLSSDWSSVTPTSLIQWGRWKVLGDMQVAVALKSDRA